MMDSLILSIKTASSASSSYQNDESDVIQPAEWDCTLPLYALETEPSCENENLCELGDENCNSPIGFLDSLLLKEWEDRLQRGVFRYDVTACETKILSGRFGFIAQLNEGRRFNNEDTEFNFTKLRQEEFLFHLRDTDSVVAINVNPIEYGHVILIPRITKRLPQRIDHQSLLLALQMAVEIGNPFFRMGYNGSATRGTVNHLHFQACYFAASFPIEDANTVEIGKLTISGVKIWSLLEYPVKGFVFDGGSTLDLSKVVAKACVCLQDNNVPFDVLIGECGQRVFLLPCVGEIWEICGHKVFDQRRHFDEASEEKAVALLGRASLSVRRFTQVFRLVFDCINGAADLSLGPRVA